MADIPVYLIAGFLDGGKTDFINGILEDGFAREDKTLLICCEEGELEYEQKALDNVTVVTVDEETALTCSQCKEWEKQYKPKQVLIEYNGMWSMERLYREVLPANWVLYQVMTFVDANTFETYAKNMGQIMMEKITNADLLVFNRCTDELKAAAGTLGDAFRADACLNLLRLMPNHNANVLCATAFCGFNHIIHHALIQNFMKYLRFLGFHTGAFAGSQNDCFQLSHLFFLLRQRAKYFSRYCIHTF